MAKKKAKTRRVPVSLRALEARVNRAIRKEGRTLRRMREDHAWFHKLGRFHITDDKTTGIVGSFPDGAALEQYARELGVLEDWEELA